MDVFAYFLKLKMSFSAQKRKPPSFFSNLHETLNILIGFFRQGDLQQQLQEQQKIEQVILKEEKILT